jgi:hypothetical protein
MALLHQLAKKLADTSCLGRVARRQRALRPHQKRKNQLARLAATRNHAARKAHRVFAVKSAVARRQQQEASRMRGAFSHARTAIRNFNSVRNQRNHCHRALRNTRRSHAACVRRARKCRVVKRVQAFYRFRLHGQMLAEATCTSLNTRGGWTFAVRRNCGHRARTCAHVCRKREAQAGSLSCFNSLHIYHKMATPHTGRTGMKVYKYNGCGGGCGPNYCCCRNGRSTEETEELDEDSENDGKSLELVEQEQTNGEEDEKEVAEPEADVEEGQEYLRTSAFRSHQLPAQVLAQATCLAMNNRAGWTMAVRRVCGGRAQTCAQVCRGLKRFSRAYALMAAFNSLHLYQNREASAHDRLGLKTYRYNSAGGRGCGPNFCCCRHATRGEETETDLELPAAEEESTEETLDIETAEVPQEEEEVQEEEESQALAPATTDLETEMGWGTHRFDRDGLDGQLLAQATCTALAPLGWSYAVKRPCHRGARLTCAHICARTTELQARRAGNRGLQCINALHIYANQPQKGNNRPALRAYKYMSCNNTACGPNYCCCYGGYGGRSTRGKIGRAPSNSWRV